MRLRTAKPSSLLPAFGTEKERMEFTEYDVEVLRWAKSTRPLPQKVKVALPHWLVLSDAYSDIEWEYYVKESVADLFGVYPVELGEFGPAGMT